MTPHRGNTVLFRSSQQLLHLCLGTLKGFLNTVLFKGRSGLGVDRGRSVKIIDLPGGQINYPSSEWIPILTISFLLATPLCLGLE